MTRVHHVDGDRGGAKESVSGQDQIRQLPSSEALAHISEDGRLHLLTDHLQGTAALAEQFASAFDSGPWGRLAGLWHDLGKFSATFQGYLARAQDKDTHVAERGTVDHTSAGAQHAVAAFGVLGHLVAYAVAGHHSGLLDGRSVGACMEKRLRKAVDPWRHDSTSQADVTSPSDTPPLPQHLADALGRQRHSPKSAFAFAFFTRMVFSALVDADFLDTESFLAPERAQERIQWPADILGRMEETLDKWMSSLVVDDTVVNRERAQVRAACVAAATQSPGFFSLTVPTGGGKTLASLAFALRHAQRHGLRRIIYVIPFTSIVEQNAQVFRGVFAPLVDASIPDPVVEHHSNLAVDDESQAARLATENWDAPLVVTTSVQFFESLYAARTSRCRKLHNIAGSVVILDEAQTLPVNLLDPCLAGLDQLQRNYGTSVVLCTATQPAISRGDDFEIGLDGVREIIPEPRRLYDALKRVSVENLGEVEDAELVQRLLGHERVLCIVNTRRHARGVFEGLGGAEGHFHLSALMCPQHRTLVLEQVRRRLQQGGTCRVASTQLIEAGVDVDFPVVYRCLAGIDSIAQAAGRCNRNGLLDSGQTFIFQSEHKSAERYFRETAQVAQQVLACEPDALSLSAVERYFRLYYWGRQDKWDEPGVLSEFALNNDTQLPFAFNFVKVAEIFRLIAESGRPVLVPWGEEGRRLCEELRRAHPGPSRKLLRRLQRYAVSIPIRIHTEHLGHEIELVHERYAVLANADLHYNATYGLDLEVANPQAFVL